MEPCPGGRGNPHHPIGLLSVALILLLAAPAAAAEPIPQVSLLDLPFAVKAMRGPGSEVALAVSTSGLLPIAKAKPVPKPSSADPKAAPAPQPDETEAAPVAVIWGEGGGAVLSLEGGAVRATLIGAEAVEGLAAAETPRGAVPGSRRALSGPLSAYLSGPTRGATGQAAGLTIRERQPLGVTAEAKPVPMTTVTLAPGPDAVFAARRPRIAGFGAHFGGTFDGKPMVLAVTASGRASALVLAGKDAGGAWSILARSPPQPGKEPDGVALAPAAIADFSGTGQAQIAAIREPDGAGALQLWSYAEGALGLKQEESGYAGAGADDVDLAALIPPEPGGTPDLALPASDRTTLVLVSLKDGIRERARILLPGPAALGVAVLGRGAGARILVGLADGRVAVVPASAPEGVEP